MITGKATPAGVPEIKEGPMPETCPSCDGKTVFIIQCKAKVEGQKHIGTGTYASCAACGWNSPMMVVLRITEEKVCESKEKKAVLQPDLPTIHDKLQ